MKDRGQMEIMGLAIVVILITLGVLFAVTVMRKPASNIEQEYKQKTIATSYLDSLLGTTTTCHRASFRELIQDCAQSAQIKCGALNSCDYIVENFQLLFDKTFTKRKSQVNLFFEGPGLVTSLNSNTPCPGELTPGIQYIASRAGTITVTLQLCG